MILDLLRLFGGPLLAAVIGGLIVHFATRRRDAENERRKQRIDYLLNAYRTLTHSTHRDMSAERAEAFENALSDVVLFGDDAQIRLAREVIAGLASGGTASLDELLVSFRTGLRRELNLNSDNLRQVPVVRFKGLDDHTPLSVVESWAVKQAETEAAVASAVTEASATGTASAQHPSKRPVDLTAGVDALRELAQVAPGAAVVSAYGQVQAALHGLLGDNGSDLRDAPELAREAADRGLITSQAVDSIEGLAVLKALSHRGGAGTGLSAAKADEFIDLAAAMLYVIGRSRPDRQAS